MKARIGVITTICILLTAGSAAADELEGTVNSAAGVSVIANEPVDAAAGASLPATATIPPVTGLQSAGAPSQAAGFPLGAACPPVIDSVPCETPCCEVDTRPGLCCPPTWRGYADFLYLRPANDRVRFAVPVNGAIVPPTGVPAVQVGPTAVVDVDFQPGFRVGFGRQISDCADITAAYTHYEGDEINDVSVLDPFVLRSLVNQPGTTSAPTDFLEAIARAETRFRLMDIDYRRLLICDDLYSVRWLAGVRYAHLEQSFEAVFGNVTTLEGVLTEVDFDGGGIRVGLEGERRAACSGFFIHGRGTASFVGGRFRGDFLQADTFRDIVVDTGWKEDRLISILDLELGIGWASRKDRFRVSTGYMVNSWQNVLRLNQFISSLQTVENVDLNNTLTFDGLFVRAEMRF